MGLGMGAEAACDACHGTKGQATQPDLNKATQADLDKAAKLNLDKADKATDLKATQSNLDKATDLKATKPNLDKAMDLKSDVKQGSPFDVGPVATGFVDLGLKDLGKPGHAGSSLKPEPKVIPPRFSKPEIAIPKKRKSPHKPYIPKNEELEEVHVDQDEDSDDVMEVRSQPAPKKMPVEKDAKAAKAYKIFEERTKKVETTKTKSASSTETVTETETSSTAPQTWKADEWYENWWWWPQDWSGRPWEKLETQDSAEPELR